jgi:S-(hydroxymethyl)glutathione dehydrogenase/alcohol dehydrogenase
VAGVCHTDVLAVRDARVTPLVLGHEGAGIVEAVGRDVGGLQEGTPVLLCWKAPCGRCRRCAVGEFEHCESPLDTEEPRVHRGGEFLPRLLNTGCFSDYVVVPAGAVVPVDANMDLEHAALVGCGVATGVGAVLKTARVEAGASVAVWGAGGVGLNVVTGAELAHASVIVAIDPSAERRELAVARGATHAVFPEEALDTIGKVSDGAGVDYAFEVVGRPDVMQQALLSLRRAGTLVLIGAAARDALMHFRPREFMSKQQRIVGCIYGSLRPQADLPLLLALVQQGRIPVSGLIGDRIQPDDLPVAFQGAFTTGVRTVVKFG